MSGIDLNRAGTPLLEIVTEPDMRSSTEAVDYAKALHALVQWLDICDGNMQEGSFRCDANVSVRRPGQPFGTRREIKNLNSFRHLQQAIDYEINWQIDELENGGTIVQATVLFDPDTGETRMMRTKEDAQDYRYFPDPDLPPLVISREWVEQVRAQHARAAAARWPSASSPADGLAPADAAMMTQSLATARYYEAARDAGAPAKLVANWVMGEVSRRLNADGIDIVESPGRRRAAGRADQAHPGRHDLQQRRAPGVRRAVDAREGHGGQRRRRDRHAGPEADERLERAGVHRRRRAGRQPEVGRRVPRRQGQGIPGAGRARR